MKTNNVIQEKSYKFAIRIVKLYRYLAENKKEHVLSKQVLRSGTSIGANVEEGIGGQSERDFYAKLNIAYKEARNELLVKNFKRYRLFIYQGSESDY